MFGLTDWTRGGTLAEYAAVEARPLTSLPGDAGITVVASLPGTRHPKRNTWRHTL